MKAFIVVVMLIFLFITTAYSFSTFYNATVIDINTSNPMRGVIGQAPIFFLVMLCLFIAFVIMKVKQH